MDIQPVKTEASFYKVNLSERESFRCGIQPRISQINTENKQPRKLEISAIRVIRGFFAVARDPSDEPRGCSVTVGGSLEEGKDHGKSAWLRYSRSFCAAMFLTACTLDYRGFQAARLPSIAHWYRSTSTMWGLPPSACTTQTGRLSPRFS